jgi:hypothetical protein
MLAAKNLLRITFDTESLKEMVFYGDRHLKLERATFLTINTTTTTKKSLSMYQILEIF